MLYNIATNPVIQPHDPGKLTLTPWYQVTDSEDGHLDFMFDSSVGSTKDMQNCDKPIDFIYFIKHIYGTW